MCGVVVSDVEVLVDHCTASLGNHRQARSCDEAPGGMTKRG